jgi:hypothetical protein
MSGGLFKKGHAKAGGRKKGTPNKRSKTMEELQAMCEASGVEPFQVFLDLCKHRDPQIQISAAREAAKYVYTQRKASEISGPEGAAIQVESSEVKEILADLKSILDTKANERGQG